MSSPAIARQPCVHSLEMWPFDADVGRSVVCLSVCVLVTPMSPAKTTESVNCHLGQTHLGPKNRVLCGPLTGATWRIRLNDPCSAAMRPYGP